MNRVIVGLIALAVAAAIGALILVAVLGDNGVTIAQALLTLALVLVTSIYAIRTGDIANATRMQAEVTRQQAEATVKLAEEAREQTKALKDTTSLTVRPSFDMTILAVGGGTSYKYEPPDEFNLLIENIGKGPARGLFIYCSGNGISYSFKSLRNLNPNDKETFSIRRGTSIENKPKVKQLELTI